MIISEEKKKVTGCGDAARAIQAILQSESEIDRQKEHVWVIGLDNQNITQYIELVSLGTLTSALLHAREVFRLAIIKAVNAIIVAHNHPSGNCEPSKQDRQVGENLREAGNILGIRVTDQIIVTRDSHRSIK
jgi:DNA repair protein RadC